MSEDSWRFRTTNGVVTVREDAIGIRSTPGYFLAGQRSHWRHGDQWERGKILVNVGGLLSSLLGIGYHLSQVGLTGVGARSAPHVFTFVLFVYLVWSNHIGEKTIPLSTVNTITLDKDDGTLVVTHEPERGYLSVFRDDEIETTLSIPTTSDIREADEIFRLRGLDLEEPGTVETETTYRVRIRNGACFCERCHSQVSPSDAACPACGYAIRVKTNRERPSEDASIEAEYQS